MAQWSMQHLKVFNDNDARIDLLIKNLDGQDKDEIRLRPRLRPTILSQR